MKIPQGDVDYLGVGELLVDFISREETDYLYNAFNFHKYQGGSPANIAVNIAKLGGTSAIAAKTGVGAMSKFLKRELLRAGVICNYIVMDHRVHTTVIFVSRTNRTADSEAFRSGDYQLAPQDIDENAIKRAKVVHASTFALSREPCRSAVRRAFEIAQRHNKIISLDPNYNTDIWPMFKEAQQVVGDMLGYATLVKASRDDASRLFGRDKSPETYIERYHSYGPKTVIFTMGAEGTLVSDEGKHFHVPSRPIDVVDATGAGDAFWAGFLMALIDGKPIEECAYVAREVVEQKLETVGPLPDAIDRRELYDQVQRDRQTEQTEA